MPHLLTAGLDEAGRGALAGPVVAGAVILPTGVIPPPELTDSKALTAPQREALYTWVTTHCVWGVGSVSASTVDQLGIKPATHSAMQQAVARLQPAPTQLLVDGRDGFQFAVPSQDIIHGDALHPCISAASIIAKVTRDRTMVAAAATHPHYGFAQHKGYGTAPHLAALRAHGHCGLHRQSFDPLRTWLTQRTLFDL